MAVSYGFFDSQNGDRKYNAQQMTEFYSGIVTNGVFQHVSNGLAVSAGTGLNVSVAAGRAIIKDHWVKNDAALTVAVPAASATYARIDAIVIRYSSANRNITITVKEGTAAASPVAPSMTRDGSTYEMALAYVNVPKNASSVTVTDKRSDSSVCGWAAVAQATSGEVDQMLNDMKTGFDGVVYSSPAAMVQGCDEKIMNSILKNEDGFLHKGYLNNDNEITYDANLQSIITDNIFVSEGDMFIYTGYAVNLSCAYIMLDSSDEVVARYKPNGFVKDVMVQIPSGVAKIRFASLKSATYPQYSLIRISKYERTFDQVLNSYVTRINFGYRNISDTNTTQNTVNGIYTDKISVSEGDQFLYTGRASQSAPVCIFFNNDTVVDYYVAPDNDHIYYERMFTIMPGVNYVRFCSYEDYPKIAKMEIKRKTDLLRLLDTKIQTEFFYKGGYLLASDEYANANSFVSYTTPKIPCSPGDYFLYSGKSINNAVKYIMYNDNTIVSTAAGTGMEYNSLILIPDGVNYIKFSSYISKSGNNLPILYVEKHPPIELWNGNGGKCQNMIGKKINVLGDSYVANNGQPVSNTWHYKMAAAYSMTYRNYGINGNGMVSGTNPMSERYVDMADDADYILVIGGTNDFNYQTDITTFKSLLGTFIQNLVAKYPTGKIVFFTIWNSLNQLNPAYVSTKTTEIVEYNNAIVEVCNTYGIQVFNSWKDGGMRAWDEAFRTAFFQSSTDHAHLNNAGHDRFLPVGIDFMDSVG